MGTAKCFVEFSYILMPRALFQLLLSTHRVAFMPKLKWFLIGTALTAFSADYLHLKVNHWEMESVATRAVALTERAQATSTACLVELAYNKSLVETWEARARLVTFSQVEALDSIDRAKEGDPEAVLALKDLGFSVSGKKLVVLRGMGGP